MVIRTNIVEKNIAYKEVLLGCFMTSIDSTKNGNSGTGESFLFRVVENHVDSWFWNENNPSIFAVFTKERYGKIIQTKHTSDISPDIFVLTSGRFKTGLV